MSKNAGDELRVRGKVTSPESPGFSEKPEEPLEPGLLHPLRCLSNQTRVKVEGGAYPYHDRGLHPAQVIRHPSLLLGSRQTHPKQISLGCVNLGDDGNVLLLTKRPERGRVAARYLEAVKAVGEPFRQAFGGAWGCSVEVASPTSFCSQLRHSKEKVGTTDPVHSCGLSEATGPKQGHAVGERQARLIVDAKEFRVALALHDAMHVRKADVLLLAPVDPVPYCLQCKLEIDSTHADS